MFRGMHFDGDARDELEYREAFSKIRAEIQRADVPTLANLYQLAGFLTALTDAPCWKMSFGDVVPDFGTIGRDEFHKTAIEINSRASQIGCELHFSEVWPRSSALNHAPRSRVESLA